MMRIMNKEQKMEIWTWLTDHATSFFCSNQYPLNDHEDQYTASVLYKYPFEDDGSQERNEHLFCETAEGSTPEEAFQNAIAAIYQKDMNPEPTPYAA